LGGGKLRIAQLNKERLRVEAELAALEEAPVLIALHPTTVDRYINTVDALAETIAGNAGADSGGSATVFPTPTKPAISHPILRVGQRGQCSFSSIKRDGERPQAAGRVKAASVAENRERRMFGDAIVRSGARCPSSEFTSQVQIAGAQPTDTDIRLRWLFERRTLGVAKSFAARAGVSRHRRFRRPPNEIIGMATPIIAIRNRS
jgi:hypothetical protein